MSDASRRPSRAPAITITIIALNALIFVLELAGGNAFVERWAAVPVQIAAGRHLETLLSSMFMHAGWLHIVGNMVFLWAFGPQIEDAMGHVRYALFYLAGGILAMLAQVAADLGGATPCLGASGAIAAVMGAFLVTYPRDRIRTVVFFGWFVRVTFIPAVLLIGFWVLTQLISLGSVADVQQGGVAYVAHVAGAVFGAVTARLFEIPARDQTWAGP